MNDTIYGGPFQRTTAFSAPMVSGYVTARLEAVHVPASTESGYSNQLVQAILENQGGGNFTVQINQTNDYSVTGPREALGGAISLVPGGYRVLNFQAGKRYLEFKATAVTSSSSGNILRANLSSRYAWNILAFGESDDTYPVLSLTQDPEIDLE